MMESPVDPKDTSSYVTVIPVDYPRSRTVSQPAEYLVEQYGDRAREEYIRGDYNINSSNTESGKEDLYSNQRFEQNKIQPLNFEREKNLPMTFEREKQCSSGGGLAHQDWNSEKTKPMPTFDRDNKPAPINFSPDWDAGAGENSESDTKSQSDQPTTPLHPLQICIYLMSRTVLYMDIANGGEATTLDVLNTLLQEEELGISSASNVFSLWMSSPLLEVQLKPHQKPLEICKQWAALITQYASASESRIEKDEPVLSFQRNVFFSKRDEERIKDQKILDLLYEEARYNVVEGRYPCEVSHYIMLGGVQARIQLGPYNPQIHTIQYFREHASQFLPRHVCRSAWAWLRLSGKNSPEVRLLEQYKRIPSITPTRKLVRKYLEFCWSLPFYGSAFFQGQVEQPVRGLTSLLTHQDVPVLVAINALGVYIIDSVQCTLFLGLKYEELSWEFAKPSQEDNPDCLPCLFIQFMVLENGARVSKILQVFSKQIWEQKLKEYMRENGVRERELAIKNNRLDKDGVPVIMAIVDGEWCSRSYGHAYNTAFGVAVMMDALISVFVEEAKLKPPVGGPDETDRPLYDTSTDSDDTQVPLTTVNRREAPQSCLSNKLSKLTLATFDEEVDLHDTLKLCVAPASHSYNMDCY